jgi:hypothetical protein
MESTSDSFENVVTGSLNRLKATGEVLRFPDGWALADWYPEAFRNRISQEKNRPKGKRSGRPKGKAAKAAKQARESKPGLEQQIETILQSDKNKIFSILQIARSLGIKTQGLSLTLGRMVKKNKAVKAQDGYRAASGDQSATAG